MPEHTEDNLLVEIRELMKQTLDLQQRTSDALEKQNRMLETFAKYLGGDKAVPPESRGPHSSLAEQPRSD